METQLLIYIVAILLVALILLFGYRSIRGFIDKGDEAQLLNLKNDLTSTIERVSLSFGEVSIQTFTFPAKYKEICFVSSDKISSRNSDGIPDLIIQAAVRDGSDSNIFLVQDAPEPFADVGSITVANGYFCEPFIRGQLRLRFDWQKGGVVAIKSCNIDKAADPNCE